MDLDHEQKRFNSMTLPQLYTRLGKITHIDKLEAFIVMAQNFKYYDLALKAKLKLQDLQSKSREGKAWNEAILTRRERKINTNKVIAEVMKLSQKNTVKRNIEPENQKPKEDKPFKRALDF